MVRSILFWFTALAGALPVLLALVSAMYYLKKQRGIRKKLGGTRRDRRTRELRKIIEEMAETGGGKQPFRTLLQGEVLSVQDYIKTRVDPTIITYNSNAVASSVFYTCFTVLQIVYAAMIPVVLLTDQGPRVNLFGAALGALVTAACAVNATCRFKEKWVQYLGLRDRLFAERSLYMASGVYRKDLWRRKNGYDYNFVELCENIIALEYRSLADKLDISDVLEAEPIESRGAPFAYDDDAEGC